MTTQKNNQVGGDQAGRDVNKPITVINQAAPRTPEMMLRLIEEFKRAYEDDIIVTTIIDKLEHYKASIDSAEEIQGLEGKLEDGGFHNLIPYAQKMKEAFFKKLMKYEHYEPAQKIYAYVLACIYSNFINSVTPHILNGDSYEVIFQAIKDNIITSLEDRLGENVLELYADEINGALYFLTGNCHIKWV